MKSRIPLVVLGVLTLVSVGSRSVCAESEQNQESMLFSTVGFQSGVIEEVQGSTIRIDGRTYVLKANVLVLDHRSRPLELERIVPTSLVKFHLKEGHIDKMMVTLPQ